ncbi:hypothetical protein CKF42_11135 [Pantoea sp. ARC270]|nr:hypothetical protein CKF42_11135 [Pantoea sp. ARC270]
MAGRLATEKCHFCTLWCAAARRLAISDRIAHRGIADQVAARGACGSPAGSGGLKKNQSTVPPEKETPVKEAARTSAPGGQKCLNQRVTFSARKIYPVKSGQHHAVIAATGRVCRDDDVALRMERKV